MGWRGRAEHEKNLKQDWEETEEIRICKKESGNCEKVPEIKNKRGKLKTKLTWVGVGGTVERSVRQEQEREQKRMKGPWESETETRRKKREQ